MLKVWIAGANGQIGRALNDVLDPMQIETLNTDLDELDITDTDEVINFGSINRPDVIINCTGITDTDECEKNPGDSRKRPGAFRCFGSVRITDQRQGSGKNDPVSYRYQRIWNLSRNLQRCMQPL